MAGKILFLLLILVFLIPTIFASTTDITVNTIASHKILITVVKPDTFPPERIQSFAPYKDTGYSGIVKVSLTTDEPKVSIKLDLITADGSDVLNQQLEQVPTGEPVFITFMPGNVTFTSGNPVQDIVNITNTTDVSNATSLNETNQTLPVASAILNETNKTSLSFGSNFSITGFVSKFYEGNSKTIFYILIVIGVIVAILIVLFIIRKIQKRPQYSSGFVHRPISNTPSQNSSLIQAERKLKEAQQEIETIKRKNEEIRSAERKFEEDRIRLDKLRRGY